MRLRTERVSFLSLVALVALAACSIGPRPSGRQAPPPVARAPVTDAPVKIGRPYQVAGAWYYPADEQAYDAVGYASWYGDAFHGGPTANGEVFDMAMVGAAHKTLPLPCYVEVTALDTGRTVLVRVNDRGPFVANRIIDLSRRAAELLGIARQGVARVRVRRVFPDMADRLALRSGLPATARPVAGREELAMLDQRFRQWVAATAASPMPARATRLPVPVSAPVPTAVEASFVGGWFVQLGAYGDRARAETLAALVDGAIEAAGALYRVRLGPYFDQQVAQAALARAQGQGYQDAELIPPRSRN